MPIDTCLHLAHVSMSLLSSHCVSPFCADTEQKEKCAERTRDMLLAYLRPQATLKNENNFCLPCATRLRRWTLGIYSCFGSSAHAQWFPLTFHSASPVTFFHPVFFIGWADARIYNKSLVSPMNWAFGLLLLRCLVAAGLLEQMGPGRRERKAGTQACCEILMDYSWDILTCWGVWIPYPEGQPLRTQRQTPISVESKRFGCPPQPSGAQSFKKSCWSGVACATPDLKKCYLLPADVWMLHIDGPKTSTSGKTSTSNF